MREWLSGGAPPCQGGGRGFDPRLALFLFGSGSPILRGFRCFLLFKSGRHLKTPYKALDIMS